MKCSFSKIYFAISAIALFGSPVVAQTNWTRPPASGPGDWFTAGNWDNGVPTGPVQAFIDNGGTAQIAAPGASATSLLLGTAIGESGTLEVGATGTLTMGLFLSVAASGMGTVSIAGGGTVSNGNGFIASNGGSIGMVTVSGAGSKWMNSGNLKVGDQGAATLNIMNGGVVTNVDGTVGTNSASISTVTVDGTGSAWMQTGDLVVGFAGTGVLNITDGGVVSNTIGTIGRDTGGMGTVTVDGMGSMWTSSGNLIVGDNGSGTLDILNGGSVSNANADLGNKTDSTGVVNVDGMGSTWTITGFFDIGVDGMGTFNVLNGGVVSTAMEAVIGEFDGTGTATVSGTGSMWTITDILAVGENGNGTLNVWSGGTVSDNSAVIGEFGTGTVNVDGAGSVWMTTGQLLVGEFGWGNLNITNGGHVSNDVAQIAQQVGSAGTVIVDGTGSLWNVGDELDIGGGFTMPGGNGLLRIINGGTVNAPFTATIWTPGVLEMDGTADLNGNLTFRGGTFRSIADLTFTHSSNIIEGAVIDTDGHTAIFSGLIGGAGDLTKINPGTLILPNDNTYSGGTMINGGWLAAGSLNAMGTGDVTVNGGTLRTFNGPRPIAVGGNYMQNAGGTLELGIGGTDSGSESDFLTVTGTASLGGTLSLVRINNFQPMLGDQVQIIGALGGVNNQFSTVTDNFGVLIRPHVVYEMDDVLIEFIQGSFNIGGLTPNQESVANNLDAAASDPRAMDLIDFLNMESMTDLPHDYDLIAPEELASIYEIGFSHANIQTLNLQRRMDDIRAGSNGFSTAGLSMALVSTRSGGTQIQPNGELLADNTPSRYMQSRRDNPWGVFVTGTGEFINVGDHDMNAPGYDITTGGFTLGVDYRVCPTFAIGLDGGYARSMADLIDDGRVTVDGGKIGLYATWFPAELYVTGAFNAGWNSYDTRRTALLGDATGSTDGYTLNGFVGAGYDWKMNSWSVGPVATIQYTYVRFDSFTEDGSLAPLHFPDQDQDSVRSTVGGRIAYDWRFANIIVRPEVRASWQHEYADTAYAIDSQFASGAGDVFSVWGPHIGRDAALVSGAVSVQWNDRVSTYVAYDGVLARENYHSHNVSGGLRISF